MTTNQTDIQPGEKRIRVAVVEDDTKVRAAMEVILSRDRELLCVGLFGSAEHALEILPGLTPSVVLMDVNLPGMDGVECVRRLSPLLPEAQLIMLTVHDRAETIFNSLKAGASGYLQKPVSAKELRAAIRDVVAGGAPMTAGIARKVVQTFHRPSPEISAPDSLSSLTPRELEVLTGLSQGYLYKEIADQLGVHYSTIHTLIKRIYGKLHVRSRAQAVAKINTEERESHTRE